MKSISFIVPSYNSEDYLNKCVDSILALGEDIEIILVDDGSTDKTAEIADIYEREYPTICKAVHQENSGHGGAINTGIQYVTGNYIAVIDSDDWIDKNAGNRIISRIKKNPEADFILCNYVYTYAGERKDQVVHYRNVFPTGKTTGWKSMKKFGLTQYFMIHSCIFKSDFLRKNWVPLPEKVFYEDNFFVNSLVSCTERILYLDEDFYYYYIGRPDQSMQEENVKKRYHDQIRVVKATFSNPKIIEQIERHTKVGECLYHHIVMMLLFCAMNARVNNSKKADRDIEKMWNFIWSKSPKAEKIFKRNFLVFITNIPGIAGRILCILTYKIYKMSLLLQVN